MVTPWQLCIYISVAACSADLQLETPAMPVGHALQQVEAETLRVKSR